MTSTHRQKMEEQAARWIDKAQRLVCHEGAMYAAVAASYANSALLQTTDKEKRAIAKQTRDKALAAYDFAIKQERLPGVSLEYDQFVLKENSLRGRSYARMFKKKDFEENDKVKKRLQVLERDYGERGQALREERTEMDYKFYKDFVDILDQWGRE